MAFKCIGASACTTLSKPSKKLTGGEDIMRKLYTKIPAIIAMLICVVAVTLVIALVVFALKDNFNDMGFLLGIVIYYSAIISYLFYLIDAILSIIKAVLKINPVFNGILAFLILGTIPISMWALQAKRLYIGLLCVYYLAVFVFEVISVIKHIKMMRDLKKENYRTLF